MEDFGHMMNMLNMKKVCKLHTYDEVLSRNNFIGTKEANFHEE